SIRSVVAKHSTSSEGGPGSSSSSLSSPTSSFRNPVGAPIGPASSAGTKSGSSTPLYDVPHFQQTSKESSTLVPHFMQIHIVVVSGLAFPQRRFVGLINLLGTVPQTPPESTEYSMVSAPRREAAS